MRARRALARCAGALLVAALWAPAASGACHRAPECSCCAYIRPDRRGQQSHALAHGPAISGAAERQQYLGVNSAYFKLKLACAAWVQSNKGFADYACQITDAPGSQYRGYVYAANNPLSIKREPPTACRSGPSGGTLSMRTSVIYKCQADPSSPPPPPPSPPSPPPNRAPGFLRLHAISTTTRRPAARPGAGRAANGGSVLTGTILTVLTVASVVLCLAGVATLVLLGGTESDFFQALRDSCCLEQSPGHKILGDEDEAYAFTPRHAAHAEPASPGQRSEDDVYSFAAQHTVSAPPAPPAGATPVLGPEEVYGARYQQRHSSTPLAAPRTGPAATASFGKLLVDTS